MQTSSKKIFQKKMCFISLLLIVSNSILAQVTNVKEGNWSDPAVWSNGIVPTDTTNISLSYPITVDGNSYCASLTTNGDSVTVTSGFNITITGYKPAISHCINLVNDTTATTDSTFIRIPSFYSPNGDGINDNWAIFQKGVGYIHYVIYDSTNTVLDSGLYQGQVLESLQPNTDSFYHYYYVVEATTVTGKIIGQCGDLYIIFTKCCPAAINILDLIKNVPDPNDPVLFSTCQ